MKAEDEQKVIKALIDIKKFEYKICANDFQLGMANLAGTILTIITENANSIKYRDAVRLLVTQSKN